MIVCNTDKTSKVSDWRGTFIAKEGQFLYFCTFYHMTMNHIALHSMKTSALCVVVQSYIGECAKSALIEEN